MLVCSFPHCAHLFIFLLLIIIIIIIIITKEKQDSSYYHYYYYYYYYRLIIIIIIEKARIIEKLFLKSLSFIYTSSSLIISQRMQPPNFLSRFVFNSLDMLHIFFSCGYAYQLMILLQSHFSNLNWVRPSSSCNIGGNRTIGKIWGDP